MKKILTFLLLVQYSSNSYSYIDPGSSNALLYVVISLFGAFFFYIKSFFYKMLCFFNKSYIKTSKYNDIAIFSEGSNYYYTFKNIITELIDRKIHFSYYSMDIYDPALTIDNEFMHSKYIGYGNSAYVKFSRIKTRLLLLTTPNIGCKGFLIQRPKGVVKMVHIWHSVCDTSFYFLGALDNYDVALTVGTWCYDSIRKIELQRSILKKELVAVGVPYLDELLFNSINRKKEYSDRLKNDGFINPNYKTILIAPSWGKKNCLNEYGIDFIGKLVRSNFNVILKPHPQSILSENELITKISKLYSNFKNFKLDLDLTYSMFVSDLLISDKSSIRFDFAFIYEKPVLTLDISFGNLKQYEASLIGSLFEESLSNKIGIRIKSKDELDIIKNVTDALNYKPFDIRKIREQYVCNFGNSSKYIADYLVKSLSN